MTTMLGLVQAATGEMGLSVPTSVIGNVSPDVVQILALLNQSGNELQREYDWEQLCTAYRFYVQFLTTTGTFSANSTTITGIPTTAGLSSLYGVTGTGINQDTYISSVDSGSQVTISQQTAAAGTAASITFGQMKYAMPSDYDRQIDRTHWDKSKHWQMLGPETAQQWEWLKSGFIATGPRIRYRIMGGYFQIWPLVATAEYLGFEYVSKNWATSASGTGQASFLADTDTCIYPDRLIINDLKRKYFGVKGFDITQFNLDYNRELTIAKSANAGSETLSLSPRQNSILIDFSNIPDAGYGT